MAQRNDEARIAAVRRHDPEQSEDTIRERFWQTVERIRARNAEKDPDEILREVTEVVEEVRQERYERAEQAQGGR